MTMSLIAIAIVLGLGYIWMSRGFFNAFLHMVCVLLAGAIAFGVWEPLAYAILPKGSSSGELLSGSVWGLALAVPFAVSVLLLRGLFDVTIRANVQAGKMADYVGGGVCGVVSGVVAAGIVVMSVGFLRVDKEFLGYAPISDDSGPIKRQTSLIFPVDKITVGLFSALSRGSFTTETPLARWQPAVYDQPHAMRNNYGEGSSRNTLKPEDFNVDGRYTLGGAETPLANVLKDSFEERPQQPLDIEGNQYPASSRIEGFVVNFTSGAKEKNGQVIIGPAQVRLVSESADGSDSIVAHPIAVVSRSNDSAKVVYARFRLDQRESFIATVGGAAENKMAFEFVVPNGYTPLALYIKNVRYVVPQTAPVTYASPQQRDAAVRNGKLVMATEKVESHTPTSGGPQTTPASSDDETVRVTNRMPRSLQDGTLQASMTVEVPYLVNGETKMDVSVIRTNQIVDKSLRIEKFKVGSDVAMVQLDVSLESAQSLLGRAAQAAEMIAPMHLVTTDGQRFEAVGYWYEDDAKAVIRYVPGEPIRAMSQLQEQGVMVSRTKPGQKLYLLFTAGLGTKIARFEIGNKVIREFDPPLDLSQVQK